MNFLKRFWLTLGWDSTFNSDPIKNEYDSSLPRHIIDSEPQYEYVFTSQYARQSNAG